jgi:spermidine/putrescine transport system permease protein
VASEAEAAPRRRRGRKADAVESGVWYPRWYWPSFTLPGLIWLALLFLLPFYVVLSVAFGTVDLEFGFRTPVPVYQPWWWDLQTFWETAQRFFVGDRIYLDPLLRTLFYVGAASLICLVLGYAVAYFTARHAGGRRGLILVLLIAPFWISYLMRIYAWQSLLQPDGYINDVVGLFGVAPIDWLAGKPITVILGLVYGYIPFMILPLFGFLDRIDQNLLEAGRDLGASPFQTFRRVTLPLSKPGILAGLVIVSLPMFGDYYTNDLLGSETTSMYGNLLDAAVYEAGRGPEAGSLVLILILLVMIPMIYYLRETRRATGTS